MSVFFALAVQQCSRDHSDNTTWMYACGRIANKIARYGPQTWVAAGKGAQYVQPGSYEVILLHTIPSVLQFSTNMQSETSSATTATS